MRQELEPRIFTEATEFYGLSALIHVIREDPRFLSVTEMMINAAFREAPGCGEVYLCVHYSIC